MRWPLIKHLPDKTNFHFVRVAKIAATLSILGIIASLFLAIYPAKTLCGGLNCGIDFKGGTTLGMSTAPKPVDSEQVKALLEGRGLRDVQVLATERPAEVLIRFESPTGANPAHTIEQAKQQLTAQAGATSFTKEEAVGAKVSGELFWNGVIALLVAIFLMMLYIWFRFGFTFGVGAVAALFHDVILTFGLFAVTRLEFSLTEVAAILTIIGYSMNDTVVVIDRVRENLRKYKRMPMGQLIDQSINETLSRTLVTGVTGLMALVVLAVFGGPALHSFSIAMIFGIIVGTYSSIFVAAPVLLLLGVKRGEEAEIIKPQPARP